MQRIEPGIFYEDAYLGVTLGAIVLQNGTIMIDAPLRIEDARSWRSMLMNQGGGPNRLLVYMDAHPDRTLGARSMESSIVAHDETAQVFKTHPMIFKGQGADSGAEWETYNEAIGIRWVAPDITFTQQISFHWGDKEVILSHQPGPTPGTIWVIVPGARVVFVGDTVVLNQPPFFSEADLDLWIGNLNLLLDEYRDFVIVSGRGGQVTVDEIRFQRRILQSVVKSMEKLAKRDALPEATGKLIPSLLSKFDFDNHWQNAYKARLRHGLFQYYLHSYHSSSDLDQYEHEERD